MAKTSKGHIQQLPSGSFRVKVYAGTDPVTGKARCSYIGGEEPGLRGGRARGKKVLTGIAVEVREPKGIGRCLTRQPARTNTAPIRESQP